MSRKVYNLKTKSVQLIGEDRDTSGHISFAPTFPHLNLLLVRQFNELTATAGETTFRDIEITSELRISGGKGWVMPESLDAVHKDDYLEFSIIDKNGIAIEPTTGLSYFTLLGYTPGVDMLNLFKFIRGRKIKVGNKLDGYPMCFEPAAIDGDPIQQGLFMRAAYHSFGLTDVDFGFDLIVYEG